MPDWHLQLIKPATFAAGCRGPVITRIIGLYMCFFLLGVWPISAFYSFLSTFPQQTFSQSNFHHLIETVTSNHPPPPPNPLKNVSNVHLFPDESPAEFHGLISKTSAPSPGQIVTFTQLKFDKLKLKNLTLNLSNTIDWE